MFKKFKEYSEASPQTKYFIINWFVYGIALLITTIYCYARLDSVRSNQSATSKRVQSHSSTEIR